jgi:hypothetical protein
MQRGDSLTNGIFRCRIQLSTVRGLTDAAPAVTLLFTNPEDSPIFITHVDYVRYCASHHGSLAL